MAGESGNQGAGRPTVGILPFDIHRAIEAAIGIALVLLPFIFSFARSNPIVDFSPAAVLVAGAIGAVAATLGFIGGRQGRSAPIRLHSTLDVVLTVALIAAALLFALRGERPAVILFASAGLAYALLSVTTSYRREAADAEPRATE